MAAKWRGIGIRIEDDVAVTATGHQVLTEEVIKTVDDIHQLMRPMAAKRGSIDPAQVDFISDDGRYSAQENSSAKTPSARNSKPSGQAKPVLKASAKKKSIAKKKNFYA